jgi:hypothetical protein
VSALRKNVASQVLTFGLVNASTGAALTGATVTVKAALDGTQSAGAGTVTELGTGQYKYVPTQGETNGTTLGLHFSATGAVPVNIHCFITATDPTDAVRMGLTALPNAAAEAAGGLYTRGTGAGQINQPANGMIDANVVRNAGTAIAAASGRQEVNLTHVDGTALGTHGSGYVPADVRQYDGSAGTFASGRPEVNTSHVAGSAVSTSSAQIGVNVVNAGGTAWATAINSALDTHDGPDLPTGAVATDAGNSATSFKTDRSETVNDFWKDALLVLTSGTLAGQVKKVTAYNGTTKIVTVQGGFTSTPADAVTFALINR